MLWNQFAMKIPTKAECYKIIDDHRMLEHIVSHSRQVCRVALLIADDLMQSGIRIQRDLVQAAALLHDITKTRSFETGENHAETGAVLLTSLGYPETGNIVRQHVKLDAYVPSEKPREPEIVNYADKRVLHDRVVSLSERMAYILEKYGTTPDRRIRILRLTGQSQNLEQRICQYCCFSPDDIGSRIELEKDSYGH